MTTKTWLRGASLRVFKKRSQYINNDGVYYTPKAYAELIEKSMKVKEGDLIYNSYKDIDEKIVKIICRWEIASYNPPNMKVLHFIFETESGYWIYDINERELCGK